MTTAEKEKYKCLLPSLSKGDEVKSFFGLILMLINLIGQLVFITLFHI